jgi:hypothetical protein
MDVPDAAGVERSEKATPFSHAPQREWQDARVAV